MRRAFQGVVQERLRLELEHVEDDVDDGAAAVVQELPARPALVVERADHAVEHAVARAQRARHARQQRACSARRARRRRRAGSGRARPRPAPARARPPRRARTPRPSRSGRAWPRAGASARTPAPARLRRPWPRARSASCAPHRPRCAGTSAHSPCSFVAVQDHGERAVLALALQLVGAAIPDLDRAAAVLARRDVALERRRSRAGDPPRAPRASARRPAAARRAAAPSSAARRRARAGSRSAGRGPSGAAPRTRASSTTSSRRRRTARASCPCGASRGIPRDRPPSAGASHRGSRLAARPRALASLGGLRRRLGAPLRGGFPGLAHGRAEALLEGGHEVVGRAPLLDLRNA